MSSPDKNSLFNPKSNALKNILKNPKEEKKSFGKEEFLARRKFFLQKLENDGGIPKPKTPINNSITKKKISNEKIKTAFIATKNTNTTVSPLIPTSSSNNNKSNNTNNNNDEKINLPPAHEWSITSAKSESLKKIIDLAEKKDTNTVGKNVFNARQKFFADSQLNSVDQLMPRPCTPPGYVYFEKCPSPSLEPRRNSYGVYSSSPVLSPSLKPASPIPSLSILSSSPTPSTSTYSLPWEYSNNKKKEDTQQKSQSNNNGIESLEKIPLISEESLPDPVNFKKEIIDIEKPIDIITENVEASKPMIPKIITLLPKPVQKTTIPLPLDESIPIEIFKVETVAPQFPKHITISKKLPESVKFEKIQLPNDKPIELSVEVVELSKRHMPKKIHLLPESIEIKKEVLPEDEPLEIKTKIVDVGYQQIPKIIKNVEQPKETINNDLMNDYYTNKSKPLIDIDDNITSYNSSTENINRNQTFISFNNEIIDSSKQSESLIDIDSNLFTDNYQVKPLIDFDNNTTEINTNSMTEKPLISFDENPLLIDVKDEIKNEKTKTNSIGSISELLINGTLSINDPLPRKSIPPTPNSEINGNLIELSESEMTDKVKNWYNVVENAINREENLEDSLI